jgi:hypothetical protein
VPTVIGAELNQTTQIGVEVTRGTIVPANIRFDSLGIELNPGRNVQRFRPRGSKFESGGAETRRWGEGSIADGSAAAYNELPYILSSILSKATPVSVDTPTRQATTAYALGDVVVPSAPNGHVYEATVAGTTGAGAVTWPTTEGATVVDGTVTWTEAGVDTGNAYLWTFDIATYARDDFQTYTIETGDANSGRVFQAPYSYFVGCELSSERMGEMGLSGDVLGNARRIKGDGFTAGPTQRAARYLTPAHLNIYMDDDSADLGETLLDGNFNFTWALTDRRSQIFFHRRDRIGPSGDVETVPSASMELVQADGEEVDEMILGLEESQRKFFRAEFVGGEIGETGLRDMVQIDMAGNIGDAESYGGENDAWAATIPYNTEHDGTWGRALRVRVRNDVSAL